MSIYGRNKDANLLAAREGRSAALGYCDRLHAPKRAGTPPRESTAEQHEKREAQRYANIRRGRERAARLRKVKLT